MDSSEFLRLYEQHQIRHDAEVWSAIVRNERKGIWKRLFSLFNV